MTGLSVTFQARSCAFWVSSKMGSTTSVPPCRGENHRSSLAGRSFSPAIPCRPGLFGTPGSNCSRPGHSLVPSHRVQRRGLGQDPLLLLHRAPPAPRGLPSTGRRTFKRARVISLAARRLSPGEVVVVVFGGREGGGEGWVTIFDAVLFSRTSSFLLSKSRSVPLYRMYRFTKGMRKVLQ